MSMGMRLSRLETIVGDGPAPVLIDAEDEDSAMRLVENAILAADRPQRLTVRISGQSDDTFWIGRVSHEDRLKEMEAT